MTTPIINVSSEDLQELCLKYSIRELGVFGSYARGEQESSSDIDVLVDFEPSARIGFVTFSKLNEELSTLMKRSVDLVTKRALRSTFRETVMTDFKLLYEA
jgi:uncharacterized protein